MEDNYPALEILEIKTLAKNTKSESETTLYSRTAGCCLAQTMKWERGRVHAKGGSDNLNPN